MLSLLIFLGPVTVLTRLTLRAYAFGRCACVMSPVSGACVADGGGNKPSGRTCLWWAWDSSSHHSIKDSASKSLHSMKTGPTVPPQALFTWVYSLISYLTASSDCWANDSLLHRELSEGRTERRESLVNRSKLSLRWMKNEWYFLSWEVLVREAKETGKLSLILHSMSWKRERIIKVIKSSS